MTLQRFEFENRQNPWKLRLTEFSAFNLLVGVSGVGKTMILQALTDVRRAALGKRHRLDQCSWTLDVVVEGKRYTWSMDTAGVSHEAASLRDDDAQQGVPIGSERITVDGEGLVSRTRNEFRFDGTLLPKLKETESAISLLGDEDSIAPLKAALSRFLESRAQLGNRFELTQNEAADALEATATFDDLRERDDLSLIQKSYMMQEAHRGEFERVADVYRGIFPTVEEIKVERLPYFGKEWTRGLPRSFASQLLSLGFRERGVTRWVTQMVMSSGMLRTLLHLLELALAPRGTVVMIDEYENSLGVNCLPDLTSHLLDRQRDLQFVITSHHPYVIENVPLDHWKVVTRRGSNVTVSDAESIPGLDTMSRQDAFNRLINSPAFEEGVR